jgi:hypothetical protein
MRRTEWTSSLTKYANQKLITEQLEMHLESNGIHTEQQAGFRKIIPHKPPYLTLQTNG